MSTSPSTVISCLRRISEFEDAVRDFINTGRHQANLLRSRETWNQICSSLDVIGDTALCIEDYLSSDYPSTDGLKYIFTYGILQALFLQQDAVRHLAEAFEITNTPGAALMKIRDIRNAAIGHPTKHQFKKSTHYNYISRISLSKTSFTLMRSSPDDDIQFFDVDISGIISDQLTDIESALSTIAAKLREADRMHREKFGGKLIADIFHSSTGYLFEKVAQGIHSPSHGNKSFGLSMVSSIETMYAQFESAMEERGELNEYTRYDLEEYKHAMSVVREYLSGNPGHLVETDARIYLFYLREQHNRFAKIAEEVDEEYKGGEV